MAFCETSSSLVREVVEMDWKGFVQRSLYGRWKPSLSLADGYCVLMPMPMDMPFLLRLALEGMKTVDTTNCRQIVVIGDGWADDGGAALREVVSESTDKRVELTIFSRLNTAVARRISCPHPLTVIQGVNVARCRHAFLHDADAFFIQPDCIERIYEYSRRNDVNAVGVTARWDPFFHDIGYTIPGTWQMMFSVPWLRTHPPYRIIGRAEQTPHGPNVFDTLLYPEYLDYGTGKVGVMPDPATYAHFNGTIVTYRAWRRARGTLVVDELFRLLLLGVLESVVPSHRGCRLLPTPEALAKGLTDAAQPVRYDTLDSARNYPEFRGQVREMCLSPLFAGDRSRLVDKLLAPFDEHFDRTAREMGDKLGGPTRKFRRHGLAAAEI